MLNHIFLAVIRKAKIFRKILIMAAVAGNDDQKHIRSDYCFQIFGANYS